MADNIDPKTQKQSIHDLNIDITETKTKDDYIIIMGDLNKKLGDDPSLMAQIYVNHNFHVAITAIHPHLHNYSTYIRGKKCLDYFLISSNMPQPTGVGHNPYNLLYKPDHQSIFLDFSITLKSPMIISPKP